MAEIKQLKEKKTDEIFYPVTVGEAVIFEDGRSVKDKIEKLSTYIETTYSNLKSLRDSNQLIPGALYRITDYVTTTVQEDTRSAGHQFDIIVQAISESVLSEDAKAIQHEFEMPEKCYSIDEGGMLDYIGFTEINGEKCYVYGNSNYEYAINASNPDFCEHQAPSPQYIYSFFYDYFKSTDDTVWSTNEKDDRDYILSFKQDLREFSYFSNSNLAAWKLKYCLDNDTNRFAWAQSAVVDGVNTMIVENGRSSCSDVYGVLKRCPFWDDYPYEGYYYAWGTDDDLVDGGDSANFVYSKNSTVQPGEQVYNANDGKYQNVISSFSGKGVIYQMIDEHNNDCPYDFKNIQFLRSLDWNQSYEEWCTEVLGMCPDEDVYYYTFTWVPENGYTSLEDTSVTSFPDDENEFVNARNNVLMEYLNGNKIELNNIILVSSYFYDGGLFWPQKNNTFKQNCHNNTFGNNIWYNVFDFLILTG